MASGDAPGHASSASGALANLANDTAQESRVHGAKKQPGKDDATLEAEKVEIEGHASTVSNKQPSSPNEGDAPPLPDEQPPEDDGWVPTWSGEHEAWYFTNRFTGVSQWENPRVPGVPSAVAQQASHAQVTPKLKEEDYVGAAGSYNPAIHGSYDPNADYAVAARQAEEARHAVASVSAPRPPVANQNAVGEPFEAVAHFNRFTGKFVNPETHPSQTAEAHSDAAKAYRQQNAYYDVDAHQHDGRSLKEERRNKKPTKKEVQAYNKKRREKKEEKRLAWLRD